MAEQQAQVIIIGGGPAGVSAALYLARAGVRTTIIENGPGALARAHKIDNYYGIAASGARLYAAGLEQAEALGVSIRQDEVLSVEYTDSFTLSLKTTAEQLSAPALILATGTKNITLNLPGLVQLEGKGISYCAVCDANFFEDFEIYVVGGNGIAAEESLYLAGYARKVTMIHKGPALTVSPMLKERLDAEPKIHVLCNVEVEDVGGDELLSEIVLKNTKTGEETVLHADEEDGFFGLFGFTGKKTTGRFDGVLDMEGGYIKTDECMRTNIPGVFAAGDVRVTPLRQVVTACADGAIAAMQCYKYISAQK